MSAYTTAVSAELRRLDNQDIAYVLFFDGRERPVLAHGEGWIMCCDNQDASEGTIILDVNQHPFIKIMELP